MLGSVGGGSERGKGVIGNGKEKKCGGLEVGEMSGYFVRVLRFFFFSHWEKKTYVIMNGILFN